jgi:thioredoxin reductase/bacterioferritin-associated ferredoxin
MTIPEFDVIVIGGGPAGAGAAIAASREGLRVLLVDENDTAGGQVYRQPIAPSAMAPTADATAGEALRARLAASDVVLSFGHRVWFVESGFRVCAVGPAGPVEWRASRLVVASGAQERHRPVPGWTLPGVIGLAGATNLLKAHRVLPGRRVVVAGTGPLLLYVAASILEAGGQVAAIVDARGRADWLRVVPQLLARPDLMARGAKWYFALRRAGVPIHHGHILSRVEGVGVVAQAVVKPIADKGDAIPIDCDSVCYGYGLMPATEIARLLGVEHAFLPERGGWVPVMADDGATSVPGLYLCGDGAGVIGAAAASIQGERVGVALARTSSAPGNSPLLARAKRFGAAMTTLAEPPAAALDAITPETIVCRCENLSRATLDDAIRAGAHTVNALKAATRCGMGACGGRVCEDSAAALIADATGLSRAEIGQATARPPLRPVPLGVLAGEFYYASLPMPEPAPQ